MRARPTRSEEHTSELQSPIDISYAVFCLKKKKSVQATQRHSGNFQYSGPEVARGESNFWFVFFFLNDPATTEIYTSIDTLSLHDALPISGEQAVEDVLVQVEGREQHDPRR